MSHTDYRLPGIYNASPITLSTGRGSALATDINGKLILSSTSGVSGIYNATPPTLVNGQTSQLQVDINSNLDTTLATSIAGEDLPNDVLKVEQRFSYLHIAAGQAATTVKSGVGVLHAIIFNGPATSTNVTTVYDNTAGSGTVIGIPLATAVVLPTTVIYDCSFSVGLTILTATANGSDMTVIYR